MLDGRTQTDRPDKTERTPQIEIGDRKTEIVHRRTERNILNCINVLYFNLIFNCFHSQLATISKNTIFPDIGNTLNYIKALQEFLKNVNLSEVELNEKFIGKLKSSEFTDSKFWQVNIRTSYAHFQLKYFGIFKEFNSIEVKSKEIFPTALWTGNLDKIDPNNDGYYKPDADILDYLKVSGNNETILTNVQNNENTTNTGMKVCINVLFFVTFLTLDMKQKNVTLGATSAAHRTNLRSRFNATAIGISWLRKRKQSGKFKHQTSTMNIKYYHKSKVCITNVSKCRFYIKKNILLQTISMIFHPTDRMWTRKTFRST